MGKNKGIDPSDDFKKKMGGGLMKTKVKVKAKGMVKPSKLAGLLKGLNK